MIETLIDIVVYVLAFFGLLSMIAAYAARSSIHKTYMEGRTDYIEMLKKSDERNDELQIENAVLKKRLEHPHEH